MDTEIMHMAEQFPLVAAFAGYVMWRAKQGRAERKEERAYWMDFLRDRNTKSERALLRVAEQLEKNEKILDRIEMRVTPGP
jgi:hypothetical protein